jgi:hypothetical protein
MANQQLMKQEGFIKPVAKVLHLFFENCTDPDMVNFVRKLEVEYKPLQPGSEGPEIKGLSILPWRVLVRFCITNILTSM